ncbi:uncharacterized protein [Primulina huaijiensis]|uniref:uncharacterized protein isoform X1 n=1 Tax=Primulina huaijiensis TaxID=1492673 RepID=UPI003CC723E8
MSAKSEAQKVVLVVSVPQKQARMNLSPTKYETRDCCSYEFDYQAGFTQFLEEARKNASQERFNIANIGGAPQQQLDGEKQKKKSWKNSIFFWFKIDRKNKSTKQSMSGATVSKPGRGWVHVSGPIQGSVGNITGNSRRQNLASGPLTGLFGSTDRAEDCYQVPYLCLGQLKNPHRVHSYGPVYLVT